MSWKVNRSEFSLDNIHSLSYATGGASKNWKLMEPTRRTMSNYESNDFDEDHMVIDVMYKYIVDEKGERVFTPDQSPGDLPNGAYDDLRRFCRAKLGMPEFTFQE